MDKVINYISINGVFWIQIKSHLISFGFEGIPKDVHFTIGFDGRSPDFNFHVTKNVIDTNNKPQIKIIEINKKLLENTIPFFTLSLLNFILQEFNIDEMKNKFDYKLGFISFDNLLQNNIKSTIEKELIDSFKDISRIKKKSRLIVKGDIELGLETYANSKEVQDSLENCIIDLSSEFMNPIEGGIILTRENALQVIRINNKWFTIRKGFKIIDLLKIFVDPFLAKQLVWKTKRAMIIVKNANSYTDIKHFNKPIRLEEHNI